MHAQDSYITVHLRTVHMMSWVGTKPDVAILLLLLGLLKLFTTSAASFLSYTLHQSAGESLGVRQPQYTHALYVMKRTVSR